MSRTIQAIPIWRYPFAFSRISWRYLKQSKRIRAGPTGLPESDSSSFTLARPILRQHSWNHIILAFRFQFCRFGFRGHFWSAHSLHSAAWSAHLAICTSALSARTSPCELRSPSNSSASPPKHYRSSLALAVAHWFWFVTAVWNLSTWIHNVVVIILTSICFQSILGLIQKIAGWRLGGLGCRFGASLLVVGRRRVWSPIGRRPSTAICSLAFN